MSTSPHQRQESAQGEFDLIKATRRGWTLNGRLVKGGIINVPAGITNVLQFETAPDLDDARIHLQTRNPTVELFVPTGVPIPDFLPAGQYTLRCEFRNVSRGDINGTLNVGTGNGEHRGDAEVSV